MDCGNRSIYMWGVVDNMTKTIVLNNTSNTNKGIAQTQDFCRKHSGITAFRIKDETIASRDTAPCGPPTKDVGYSETMGRF